MANNEEQAKCRKLAERDLHRRTFVAGTVVDPKKPEWIKVQLDSGSTVAAHPTGRMRREAGSRLVQAGDRVIVCLPPDSISRGFLWAYVREEDYRFDESTRGNN